MEAELARLRQTKLDLEARAIEAQPTVQFESMQPAVAALVTSPEPLVNTQPVGLMGSAGATKAVDFVPEKPTQAIDKSFADAAAIPSWGAGEAPRMSAALV